MRSMRILTALLVLMILTGVAPLAAAAGFCAGKACCPSGDEAAVMAADCCNDISCAETSEEFAPAGKEEQVTSLSPLSNLSGALLLPQGPQRRAPVSAPVQSPRERLASLSILLI